MKIGHRPRQRTNFDIPPRLYAREDERVLSSSESHIDVKTKKRNEIIVYGFCDPFPPSFRIEKEVGEKSNTLEALI